MKKTLVILGISFIIIITILSIILINTKSSNSLLRKENGEYEYYIGRTIYGTDITTVINKAMNTNKKFEVPKDENGFYITDGKCSMKVYLEMIGREEVFAMEKIDALGSSQFAELFNTSQFEAKEVKYHENTGRIAEITFIQTEE